MVKIVEKPWGREIWYAQSARYVGKIIHVKKGHRLSRQYHKKKHETVYTLRGRWRLELGGRRRIMKPGDAAVIRPGAVHRFESPFGPTTLLEVSTPEVWDVVRISDDYGRKEEGI